MHTRIAYYRIKRGSAEEIARRAEAEGGLLDQFSASPGYISYELVAADDGGLFSISRWESWEQAEEAARAGESWAIENIADVATLEESHVGEVILPSQS
ncbi:MAG: antibiotic biosynthesis monooxygenase [Gaiellaceae bacterium]